MFVGTFREAAGREMESRDAQLARERREDEERRLHYPAWVAQYRRRRALSWAVGLGGLAALATGGPLLLRALEGGAAAAIMFAAVAGLNAAHAYIWRCPRCRAGLGRAANPARCPGCGLPFRPRDA